MYQQPGFPNGVPDWLQQPPAMQQPPPPPMLGVGGAPFAPPVAPTMAMAPLPSAAAGVSVLQAHSRHIWVGNLVGSITEAELHAAFSRYGAVDGVSTYPGRNYAFVNMKARRLTLPRALRPRADPNSAPMPLCADRGQRRGCHRRVVGRAHRRACAAAGVRQDGNTEPRHLRDQPLARLLA